MTTHSITYMRDEAGTFGFACSCGHIYNAPTSAAQDTVQRANLVDYMIRHHERKHKKKR